MTAPPTADTAADRIDPPGYGEVVIYRHMPEDRVTTEWTPEDAQWTRVTRGALDGIADSFNAAIQQIVKGDALIAKLRADLRDRDRRIAALTDQVAELRAQVAMTRRTP